MGSRKTPRSGSGWQPALVKRTSHSSLRGKLSMKQRNRERPTRNFGATGSGSSIFRSAFRLMSMASFAVLMWTLTANVGGQNLNVEVVGQIGSNCTAVCVEGNYAYVGERPWLTVLDVSVASAPVVAGRVLLSHGPTDVFVSSGFAYVAWSDLGGGLQIVDISDPSSPTLRASYGLPGNAWAVHVSGNLAYVANGASGVQIIDVSDPNSPALRSSYNPVGEVWSVFVSGNLAYVAGQAGLGIVDVSDPTSPTLRSLSSEVSWAGVVFVSGNMAYVGRSGMPNYLTIVDVSDPSSPTSCGSYEFDTERPFDFYVSNGLAYLAYVGWPYAQLEIIDVGNPWQPRLVGSCTLPDWDDVGVSVSGGFAYVAGPGLSIIAVEQRFVGSYDTPGHAGGLFLSGTLAYVADGTTGGLQIIDITNPTSPTLWGSCDTPGGARAVAVSNGLACVADGPAGLQIIDVGNPSLPTLRGSYQEPGEAEDVHVSGSLAFAAWSSVGSTTGGLRIVDVSDPSSPRLVGSCLVWARRVFVSGGLAYVVGMSDWSEPYCLGKIVDVSNPSRPTVLGSFGPLDDVGDIYVVGSYAYLTETSTIDEGFLRVVDVSAPSSPASVALYSLITRAGGVFVSDNLAYVGVLPRESLSYPGGLQVIDVSDPTSPTLQQSFIAHGGGLDVAVSDSVAFLAAGESGMKTVDVRYPADPIRVGSYDPLRWGHAVLVSGDLAYLAWGHWFEHWDELELFGGLHILDVSDPAQPRPLGRYRSQVNPWRVFLTKDLAYLAGQSSLDEGSLQILDVSNPSSPTLRGSYPMRGMAWDVCVSGNLAYVPNGSGLLILDVSDPSSPTLRAFYGEPLHETRGVHVSGNLAYVGDSYRLWILDVTDPSSPTARTVYPLPDQPFKVLVSGSLAYVACANTMNQWWYTGSLQIIDVSNPSSPTLRGSYGDPWRSDPCWDVYASADRAYVATGGGLQILNVSDPSSPTLQGYYRTPGPASGVFVSGDLIYVADSELGLFALRYTGPAAAPAAPTGLTAAAVSSTQINLSWQDNSDNEDAFEIERKTGAAGTWAVVASNGPNAVNHQDMGLSPNTTYCYRVRAYNAAGNSAYSNETSATTPSGPAAPSDLTVTGIASSQINLTWLDNSNYEDGYRIERKTGSTGSWSEIALRGPDYTWYQDTGLLRNTTYFYRVRAYNATGNSAYSNETSATTWAGGVNLEVVSQIGGGHRAIQVVGNYAYAGEGPSLVILDISNPDQPRTVGRFLSHPTAFVCDVFVTGGVAYVANRRAGGLQIVDVSNPSSPTLLGSYNSQGDVSAVHASGNLACIVDATSQALHILDVSNPRLPTLRSIYSAGAAYDVFLSDGLAYVAAGPSGLLVIDVSNPDLPTLRGSCDLWGYSANEAIYISGNLAYVRGSGFETGILGIIDISNPSQPVSVGAWLPPGECGGRVFVSGGLAYIPVGYGLEIVDVSIPSTPTLRASYETWHSIDVCVAGNIAYLASPSDVWSDRLIMIDVSDPSSPTLRTSVPSPNRCYDVGVGGGIACLGMYPQHLYTLDVSNPAAPGYLGSIESSWEAGIQRVRISGDRCFVAASGRLEVFDISNPSSPRGPLAPWAYPYVANDIFVRGNLLYIAGQTDAGAGLIILDVSDTSSPVQLGFCPFPCGRIYADDNYVYASEGPGLRIFDVRNPSSPTPLGWCPVPGAAWAVFATGGFVYLANGGDGLQIVDARNPRSPVVCGSYPTPASAWDVEVADGLAYVTCLNWSGEGPGDLLILDVTNPSSPFPRDSYHFESMPTGVQIDNGLAYVATYGSGLWILRCTRVGEPPAAPSDLTATLVSSSQISLSWSDNSNNEDGFKIERKMAVTAPWEQITTVVANQAGYLDAWLSPDTTYYYRVRAFNSAGDSPYSNEAWATTPSGIPNLALVPRDFGPAAPTQVRPGDLLDLEVYVVNNGNRAAGPFWVEVWGSRTGGLTLDRFLATSLYMPYGLAGGDTYPWFTSEPLYSIPDGSYTVVYAADRPGDVAELYERDNRAAVLGKRLLVIRPQTQVDLAIENFAMDPNHAHTGDTVSFTGRVVNRGRERSGPFWIEFWGSASWPYPGLDFFLCDSIGVAGLGPGEAVDLSAYPRRLYGVPRGTFQIGCFADRDDAINELDETNNYFFSRAELNLAPGADRQQDAYSMFDPVIRVVSADVSPIAPAQLAPGSSITLTAVVTNDGFTPMGPFWLEYWGSRDGGVTISDFLTDSDWITGLGAGQTIRVSARKRLYGIADGPYTVVVFANRPDVTNQSKLAIAGKRLLVIRPPKPVDLFVGIQEAHVEGSPPQLAIDGTVYSGGWGQSNSGPFWIEFWLCPGDQDYPWLDRFACDSLGVENLPRLEQINLFGYRPLVYNSVPPGEYSLIVFVDRLDQVNEADRTGNYQIVRHVVIPAH